MSKVDAEIQELRLFANKLRRMSDILKENFSTLIRDAHRIDETWRDEDNAKFMAEFAVQTKVIFKIAEQMNAYSSFINRKTDHLDGYKNVK